uniref:CRISPR system Cms protein Csm5 n=1 Tax=Dictyoglomus turgidum TaxID=513050 RepID=A0A7C3SN96_9BACT
MIRYKITIEALSPIHIGCDEILSPVEFVIDSEERKLIKFSLFDLLEVLLLEEKNELDRISNKKDTSALVDLYKLYAYRLKDKIKKLSKIKKYDIPSELAKRYDEVLKLSPHDILQNFNNFEIPRTCFNPLTDQPIIPGSSLKGALRTGYLEFLLKKNENNPSIREIIERVNNIHPRTKRREINEIIETLEKKLLNCSHPQNDPFGALKISDLNPISPIETKILYQVNVSKQKGETRGRLTLPIEVIPPGAKFEGILEIKAETENLRQNPVKIEISKLGEGVWAHFKNILSNEYQLSKNIGFKILDVNESHQIDIKERKVILIKLGKHSGAEAMTIDKIRKILIRREGGRTEYQASPTTIWLASEQKRNISQAMPFGWAFLRFEKLS